MPDRARPSHTKPYHTTQDNTARHRTRPHHATPPHPTPSHPIAGLISPVFRLGMLQSMSPAAAKEAWGLEAEETWPEVLQEVLAFRGSKYDIHIGSKAHCITMGEQELILLEKLRGSSCLCGIWGPSAWGFCARHREELLAAASGNKGYSERVALGRVLHHHHKAASNMQIDRTQRMSRW